MARTLRGDSFYYFEHKTEARNDIKLMELDEVMGTHIGYAIYFKSLELMAELHSPFLERKQLHSRAIGISHDKYILFLDTAINIGLFQERDEGVYSPAFLRWIDKKARNSESGSIGGKKSAELRKQKIETVKETVKQNTEANKDIPITPDIESVRKVIDELIELSRDAVIAKPSNRKCTLSNINIQTLIDKHGLACVKKMALIFYQWKLTSNKAVKSDYLSIMANWVIEKAGNVNDKHEKVF